MIVKIKVPVILGPTAAGKTALALEIASAIKGDILSCDSRQIYRYMDIGTAKPSSEELSRIRHWMIDIVDPDEYFSAHLFSCSALEIIRKQAREGRTVIICGGTGFYFHCLKNGMGPQIENDPQLRKKFEKKVREQGPESIFNELKRVDPESAGRIHPHDVCRNIRALEIFYKTGQKKSELQKQNNPPGDLEFKIFILALPRDILYNRINARVHQMVEHGLWDEFVDLRKRGYGPGDPGMECVGYKELFEVEEGRKKFPEAVEVIKQNTRRYAKRQNTWLKNHYNGIIINQNKQACLQIEKEITHFLSM
ncbi:MAG: tRNA (adenosine(37)-N6)-dimethylallyltransferase MiaA [Chitinivibrionales bacterium]|nr:tRNA (adenosine(37)-N6)-dimethylallyltransferase MiaA [Chitinivibrionales bacterium]